MKYNRLLFFIFILFALPSCANNLSQSSCSAKDSQKIEHAIKSFLEEQDTISYDDVVVLSKKCAQEFARSTLHPKKPVTDDATIYLKKTKNDWRVIQYGTDFNPEFLAKIPESLKN